MIEKSTPLIEGPGLSKVRENIEYVFTCTPDQSKGIVDFLIEQGIHVTTYKEFPAFSEAYRHDIRKALQLLFDHRIEGWWNMRPEMIRQGILTQGTFDEAMKKTG